MKINKYYKILTTILLLMGCNKKMESKVEEKTVPLFFTMISDIPPYTESLGSTFMKSYNNSSINSAQENHADSAEVLLNSDSLAVNKLPPVYDNTSFFLVHDKAELDKIDNISYDKKRNKDSIAATDFRRDLILIVTQPPSNYSYYDIVSEYKTTNDTLHLSLSSTRSTSPESTDILKYVWLTGIYKVQKREYQILQVKFGDKSTFFNLNKY
ncbi:hypothetical protein [Chryseobacterium sp. SIMBA_029]|uniref:hypothetical protein n=1 Tax=Chryseobacterium sp. SIMBA_029 TaxID=3085772 RepID=UPI00397A8E66